MMELHSTSWTVFFMRNRKKSTWKYGEIALLVGLAMALVWGVWSLQTQDRLEKKMIRLHVIANSDTKEDQDLKLQVRDRVLTLATELLASSQDMQEAEERLAKALPTIETEALQEIQERGYPYRVTAQLEQTEFPTKHYDGFSLPSGEYLALRLVIGEGQGHNWWCVVYPPLCTTAATDLEETAITAGLEKEDVHLMTEENTGYELKFRSLELWENFRQWLKKV